MPHAHHQYVSRKSLLLVVSGLGLGIVALLQSSPVTGQEVPSSLLSAPAGFNNAQADSIAPGTVTNLTADVLVPTLLPPCGPVTLYPTVNAMGISITVPVLGTDHASVRYRPTSSSTWIEGHPAVLTNTGRVDGSLFWLSPSTGYDVEVTSRDAADAPLSVNHCVATTQPDVLPNTVTRTLYVDAAAPPGGNGGVSQPYTTIQAAATVSQPGDQITVKAGVYHEGVTLPRSGRAGSYISIVGEPGAIMDGSDMAIEQNGVSWVPDPTYQHVYSTTLPVGFYNEWYLSNDPIWRDENHFYGYVTLAGLRTGLGHWDVPIDEGWLYETATRKLTIRSLTDPNLHTWHIRTAAFGFSLSQVDYIRIVGMTMKFYPTAVYIRSGSQNIFEGNNVLAENGVLLDASAGPLPNGNRIEHNYFHDAPLGEWGYDLVKGTPMETGAIVTWQGTGSIIRDNSIEQHFNGVYTGDSVESDVYRNLVRNLGDDGIETDGNAENIRVWGNAVDNINSGLSLAPTTVGPVWAIYNRFTEFSGRAIKIGGGVSGYDFLYHNTMVSSAGGTGTQQVTNDTNHIVFRNNVFSTSQPAIRWTEVMPGVTMDYDNAFSTYVQPYLWLHAGDTYLRAYQTLSELCSVEGQECHGISSNPQLVDPANGAFGLTAGSPGVDAAVPIPGINMTFTGAGPDLGYLERGQPEPHW